MEKEENGLQEAASSGVALATIAFDIVGGNYVKAGITGIFYFGKYLFVFITALLLIVTLIANMVSIIIGDILGFSSSSEYIRAAIAYDSSLIKETVCNHLFDEPHERERLLAIVNPLYEEMQALLEAEFLMEPVYEGYMHEMTPAIETFFEEPFGDWISGILLHEADGDLLQRIKLFDGSDSDEEAMLLEKICTLIADTEDKYLEIKTLIEGAMVKRNLLLYGADVLNPGETILLDQMEADGLSEEEMSEYLAKGYLLEEIKTSGCIVYSLLPEEVPGLSVNREYILVRKKEDIDLLVTLLKILGENLTVTETQDKVFKMISWLDITSEDGNGQFGQGTLISSATKEDVLEGLEEVSDVRREICEFAISCVGQISYVWGGTANGPGFEGIRNGLDCSHFIDWVFWTVIGDNFGNSSTMGMGKYMVEITDEELLPGDLAFTKPPGSKSTQNDSNHVLIFVGRNKAGERIYVDARSKRSGVCMSTYPDAIYYYRPHCIENE